MNGISFLLSIGAPAWPRAEFTSDFWRIVIGPFSLIMFFQDMDMWLANLSKKQSTRGEK